METTGKGTSPTPEPEKLSDWQAVDALFDRALDQPAAARVDWVRSNAPTPALANEVLALLAATERPGVLDRELPVSLLLSTPDDVRQRLSAALEGRYRIDSVLGEGGAATVFLAQEQKHDRAVVLKVLRPEAARWIGAERFLSEIQILARSPHPHILALLDSGEADGLLYYVMPYVGGETLRDRLARGVLPPAEAIPLLRDIAAALAHAHGQRLIHRDLKPDNILVVDGHAFLMDFGIAKLRRESRGAERTDEGFAIGTPAYMAPEQAAGVGVDVRADVYSWGVVATEVFAGREQRNAGVRALPTSVPRGLRRLIARALEIDSAKRPSDGAALLARFDAVATQRGGNGSRSAWLVGAAAAVILAAAFVFSNAWRSRAPALSQVAGPVMVAPLVNETGDTTLGVWGRMAGDWMTQGLHETGRVTVVPWPVALQASAAARDRGGDVVRALAAETDAKAVVTGAYYLSGSVVRLQAQVTDVNTGTVLAALQAIDVPRDSIGVGIQQLRDRLMAVFAIRTDERLAELPGMVDKPPTYDAYRAFERGVDRFNALDYGPAGDAFVAAWRSDTTFTVPLVYAATTYLNQSQYQRADSLVRAMRARGVRLNQYHELTMRYTEALLAGDAPRALEMARQAAAIAPGGRAQYIVGTLAMSVGRVSEALAALGGIDPDRGVMRGWAPYWYEITHAQHLAGDFALERTTTEAMRKRYPDSRAGLVHEVRVLAAQGKIAAVDSAMARASALPPDTYWSQGAMLVTIGAELDAHHHAGSGRYYQLAITWLANQLARDPSHRAHRYWMGSVHLLRGAPSDAEPYFESLVRDFPDEIRQRGLWGLTAALSGDTALARKRLGPAPDYRRGDYLEYLARYAAVAGDDERAIALWSEAVGTGVTGMVWLHATAQRDIARIAADPRFRRLGVIPPPPKTQ